MAALVVLSLAFAFAVWRSGGVGDFDRSVTLLLIGAAAILASFGRSARNSSPPPEKALWVVSALLAAWIGFSLIPLPLDTLAMLSPRRAAQISAVRHLDPGVLQAPIALSPSAAAGLAEAALGAVVTVLLVRHLSWIRRNSWTAVIPLGAVAALSATLGLAQTVSGTENPAGTYVNRNHYGAQLAVALPFLVMPAALFARRQFARELDAAGGLKASVLVIASGLVLSAILLSQSRGASIAAVCGLATMAALLAARGLSGVRLWMARAAVVAATVAGFVILAPQTLIQRFAEERAGDATSADRIQFWKESAALVRDYPVFGAGLGGYESALQPYRRSALLWRVDYAHNDYLQLVSELGIPGAALIAGALAIVLARVRRACAHPRGEDHHFASIACAGAWAAILTVSLADFNLYISANAMSFAWVAGLSLALGGSHRMRSRT